MLHNVTQAAILYAICVKSFSWLITYTSLNLLEVAIRQVPLKKAPSSRLRQRQQSSHCTNQHINPWRQLWVIYSR